MSVKKAKIKDLIPDDANFNQGTEFGNALIEKSLTKFGAGRSILLDKNNRIIAGNKTIENAVANGFDNVQIVETDGKTIIAVKRTDVDLNTKKGREMALADNATAKANISWDFATLDEWEMPVGEWGIHAEGEPESETTEETAKPPTLADRFLIPPFSVLDARQGYWQDRKRAWLALGIQSELGRGEGLIPLSPGILSRTGKYASKMANDSINSVFGRSENAGGSESQTGTSIFDPVLCELAYSWFCPPDGKILDPFAGGSVRGIVANYLGRHYTGIDLRPEQIAANEAQATLITPKNKPRWICGNSLTDIPNETFDFVFSCPPYYDLEVYSDSPGDLSAHKTYADFIADYREIIKQCIARLADDRFACFVIGDIRDKKGIYRNFVSDTIAAFQDAGAKLYNEAILVTAVGSLPIRVGRQFDAGRKLGKTHQNVLFFVKGDPKKATQNCGKVEIGDIAEAFGEIA